MIPEAIALAGFGFLGICVLVGLPMWFAGKAAK